MCRILDFNNERRKQYVKRVALCIGIAFFCFIPKNVRLRQKLVINHFHFITIPYGKQEPLLVFRNLVAEWLALALLVIGLHLIGIFILSW
jgi:hypothetical protein